MTPDQASRDARTALAGIPAKIHSRRTDNQSGLGWHMCTFVDLDAPADLEDAVDALRSLPGAYLVRPAGMSGGAWRVVVMRTP